MQFETRNFSDGDFTSFTVTDEDGSVIEFDVLLAFDSEDGSKHYLVYTDNTVDEEGRTRVYAGTYFPSEVHSPLYAVESEEELAEIQSILEELIENASDAEEE